MILLTSLVMHLSHVPVPDKALQIWFFSFFLFRRSDKYFAEDSKHRTLESIQISIMQKP